MSKEKNENDAELNELLDNALQDFESIDNEVNCQTNAVVNESGIGQTGAQDADEFFVEQAKLLAGRMSKLLNDGEKLDEGDELSSLAQNSEQILSGFKKLAETAVLTLQGQEESNPTCEEVGKYSESIAQTLKSLQEGANNLEAPVSGDDVANMFSSLNLENAFSDNGNDFLPFMESMMQSLLSAEILLPSIQDLLDKYPKYLSTNADKLSAEEKDRYNKQLELYKTIKDHLEKENVNDTPAEKREKFKIVLEDMRKLQEYGQPPQEVLGEIAGDLPMFDSATMGANSGDVNNPQCPMM